MIIRKNPGSDSNERFEVLSACRILFKKKRRLFQICLALSFALWFALTVFNPPARSESSSSFPVSFVDIAVKAGLTHPVIYGGIETKKYIIEANGCGVAFYDYDNDGWMDLFVMSGRRLEDAPKGEEPSNRLYRNNRDGTFTDVTKQAGLARTGWASALCIGDYDNDGFDDLFLTYWGSNVLYHNNRNGTFTDVTARAGLGFNATQWGPRWGSGCSFIDYDRDGDLDLFVANYLTFDPATVPAPGKGANCVWKGIPVNCGPKGLPFARNWFYRNDGDGRFTDVSEKSGIGKVRERYSLSVAAADFDEDGWIDIYVAGDSTASILYRNNHDGTFTDIALQSGVAYNEDGNSQAGMGLGIGDYDCDGRLDIFKTNFADDTHVLYRNLGKMSFEDVTTAAGLGKFTQHVSWGAGMPDLDNDGWPDLVFITGNVYPEIEKYIKRYTYRGPRFILRNLRDGHFEDVTTQSGEGANTPHSSRGAAFGDFDNDGDLDILVMNMNEPPSLLRNDYSGRNNWLEVKTVSAKSSSTAVGARVIVTSGKHRQAQAVLSQSSYFSHDDTRLHFGLGESTKADQIEIFWPSGRIEVLKNIPANQLITVKESIPK